MKDEDRKEAREALTHVYNVMDKTGYNALDQLVGYLGSGDPTYISTKENARNIISKVDRDNLLLELLTSYFE